MEAVLPMRRRSHGSIRSPVVKRDNQSLVVIKGWLYKLEGGALKQWKRRWCVLADFCIFFYKSPNEDKVFSTVLLPSYKINPCDAEDRISRKFAFKAEHHNMKTYYFAAENKESMKRWMNAMSLASIMQNFGKSEKVESGLGSTSNDEEDSGFTSYRSRRFGDQDPNSTFDSSHGSDGLKQRSHSCGERVGEMYLSSDDKYPTLSKSSRQYSYQPPVMEQNCRPRQPLYANAPPKPRRLTQSDPYAISPGEQYDEMGYNLAHNPFQYQDPPEMYGYPDVTYPSHLIDATGIPLIEQQSNHYRNEVFHDSEHIPSSNSYPKILSGNISESANCLDHPQRPHSADFLERDTECFTPVQNQGHEVQRQRPKSSMEYYGRYWDAGEYSADDYRDAVRMQADNLYINNMQMTQDKHHYHSSVVNSSKYNSRLTVPCQKKYLSPKTQQPVFPTKPHPKRNPEGVVSTQINKRSYHQPSHNVHMPGLSTKKKHTHEESMKRLLEWKQRMLQSPLSKRAIQYSSSSSEAGSPRRPPNRPPLPNEYRAQVIQELETHEARIGKQSMHNESLSGSVPNYNPAPAIISHKKHPPYPMKHSKYMASIEKPCIDFVASDGVGGMKDPYFTGNNNLNNEYSQVHKSGQGPDTDNVMYCVDSENNELLIYGDDYVTEIPTNEADIYVAEKYNNERKICSEKIRAMNQSSASDVESTPVHHSSYNSSTFLPHINKSPAQGSPLRRTTAQNLNVSYSSDDEASVEVDYRYKRGHSRNKSAFSRTKNVSDSEIQVKEPCHFQKLVQLSEGIMNKGKRLGMSAGDLLGKTHEELVLLLIQLRRNQTRIIRAKEKCLLQLENMRHISQVDESMHQTYVSNRNELLQQVALLEEQYNVTRPVVNLVDNMVKLGSLFGSNEKKCHSFLHLSTPDLNTPQDKLLQSDLHASPPAEEKELQEHFTDLHAFDKGLTQESHSFSSLQQDKEMLENTLHGMRSKILDHQDKPIELQKLRKQQRMIEKELTRVKRLLSQSAKKIEDATTKNDQLEQEILLLRQKLQQALKTGSCELKSSQSRADLEAELSRVQNVLEELANHRQEINNTVETLKSDAQIRAFTWSSKVRASPTGVAGSAPLPLRKKQQSTYFETDLDTMVTCDLSNVCRGADDIPVYANAEEINNPCVEAVGNDSDCQDTSPLVSSTGSDKENLSQCSLQDINEADEKMKRFYGILPREKPCEIKTVRIVKRQSERRNRERDKKRVTYGDQSSVWVVEEPDLSSDDHLETEDESIKRITAYTRPTSFHLPSSSNNKPSGLQSAHERLFGNNCGQVKEEITEGTKTPKRSKRRHYTVSGCQQLNDPLFEFSRDKPRSRDDVDMERCLRTANTPDIVRSTIKKKEVFDDKIIDRELGLPQKINIPERYIEDEPENLSASERLRRSLKAENIRKMLSETTANYENVTKSSNAPPETLHRKFTEQKRKRAHLLALNHALAQEVMERSKAVAATNVFNPDTAYPP